MPAKKKPPAPNNAGNSTGFQSVGQDGAAPGYGGRVLPSKALIDALLNAALSLATFLDRPRESG